jgi:hypothetical protein
MIRALEGVEKPFVRPDGIEFMQLALKFTTPSVIPKVLSNFHKLFKVGLQTRIINDAYYRRDQPPPVAQIPSWITDCEQACGWLYSHHRLPLSEGLCTLGASDQLVVVNASHNVADGGFLRHALWNCMSDGVQEPPLFPATIREKYAPEIAKSIQLKPVLFPYQNTSSFFVDPHDVRLAPTGTPCMFWRFRIQGHQLSCYDKRLKRPKGLAESLWIAKALALATRGKSMPLLAIPVVVDLRRYVDQTRIDNTCVNHVTAVCLSVQTSPEMKLSEVAKKLRLDMSRYEKSLAPYYSTTVFEYFPGKQNHCYGNSSFLGPVDIKPPLKDFYVGTANTGIGVENQILMFAFSRVTPEANELCVQARFSPTSVPVKSARIIVDSVKHFLKTIPLTASVGEAHQELAAYQAQLDREL